jgi:RHS repeat-associated protein
MNGTAFSYSPLKTVILGESLVEVYDHELFYEVQTLTEIISLATSPPLVSGFGFSNDVPIYVPDNSLQAYATNEAWRDKTIKGFSAYIAPNNLPGDAYIGEYFEYKFETNANSCVEIDYSAAPSWLTYNLDADGKHRLSGIVPNTPGPVLFNIVACLQGKCFASHEVAFEVVANPCVGVAPLVTIARENEGTPICPGGTIRLEAVVEGGHKESYTYEWYNSTNVLLKTGPENHLIISNVNNSKLGNYQVVLTDTEVNCRSTNSYELTSALFYNVPTVTVGDMLPATCSSATDGEVSIAISGTDATYSFTLSRNGQEVESVTNVSSGSKSWFETLSPGSYAIRGTTSKDCVFTGTFTIQNGGPRITNVCTQLLPVNLTNGQIVNTTVSFTATRERYAINYGYNILNSTGVKMFAQNQQGDFGYAESASFNYVHGEEYTIQIYEYGTLCTDGRKDLVFTQLTPRINAPAKVHRCFEGQNVTISALVSFNFNSCTPASLSYSVELLREVNGSFTQPVDVNHQMDAQNNVVIATNSSNHPAGRYLLKFNIDDNNYGTLQLERIIEITENSMIDLNVLPFVVTCPGGKDGRLVAEAKGGVPPYSYYWYNEAEELVSTTSEATMLSPGDYTLKITDSRDCNMEVAFGPYTINDKEPWGDISVVLPNGYSDNCSVEATITGVEEGMTYTFEWIRILHQKMVRLVNNVLVKDLIETETSAKVWTDRVKVPAGSTTAISISNPYYVEPGHAYFIIIRDENGCVVNSLHQENPLYSGHVARTPFMLETIQVERRYNLVFAWKTRVQEVVEVVPPAIKQNERASIAASTIAQDMIQEALKCAAITGKLAEVAFEDVCLSTEMVKDEMTLQYNIGSYHYTLYYYDRAGNLAKTVPPKGINLYTGGETWAGHNMVTEYKYNSLGQLIWQKTPDAGESRFLYNNAGQLRFSQNAQQDYTNDNTFSYSKYDELGRIRETGQGNFNETAIGYANWDALVADADNIFALDVQAPLDDRFPQATITGPAVDQRTITWYGETSDVSHRGNGQRYLLNRVSHTAHTNKNGETITTYFSYDPHGNVEWMVQDLPLLGKNYMDYEYDLISGNVTQVAFNRGRKDQFFHRYKYDDDNRIKEAQTSDNGITWESDARYSYYKHGPLKRIEMGKDKVQGVDYVYTIQGWLKAINHPALTSSTIDPGSDGLSTKAARDVFGMLLTYYQGDFKNNNTQIDRTIAYSSLREVEPLEGKNLYNGNIAAWTHRTSTSTTSGSLIDGNFIGQQFVYDKLNRIKESKFNTMVSSTWQPTDNFNTSYVYDANGNIFNLRRNSDQGNIAMDELIYDYPDDNNNRLGYVTDLAPDNPQQDDIDNQQAGNYEYDAIGNLTKDVIEGIVDIDWNVQGKVTSIQKNDNSMVSFTYDAFGNRVTKKVLLPGGLTSTSYYVRDAQGNVMGVYRGMDQPAQDGRTGADHLITLSEQPIYGSSRLGMRLGLGMEIKRLNFPTAGGVVEVDGGVDDLNQQVIFAKISPTGASLQSAKAIPGIKVAFKALTASSYSFALDVDKTNYPGDLRYNLLQNNEQSIWSGQAGTTALYSQTITAGAEITNYNLYIQYKSPIFETSLTRDLYAKQYEITDHLGNVRAVVGAGLEYISLGKTIVPRVIATNTYYPFGMLISSLSSKSEGYRYGFNGKEKDDQGEWGMTNYDYGFRIYNPGIGRFLSVDPLTSKYPFYTPYQFAGNKPIWAIDIDGLEEFFMHKGNTASYVNGKIVYSCVSPKITNDFRPASPSKVSLIGLEVVKLGVSFTPAGIAIDIDDTKAAFSGGSGWDKAFALAAWIPFGGDLLKGIRKTSNVVELSSSIANKGFKYGPYKRGSSVLEFTIKSQESFVRVFKEGSESGPIGQWIMKESELLNESGRYLNPVEIQNKFSLPEVPDKILDVIVPSGTKMRVGETGAKVNKDFPLGEGGGIQFQLKDLIPKKSFKVETIRNLE